MFVPKFQLLLPIRSDRNIAVAAIDRSAFTGLERYFAILAALGTHCGKHLALWSVAIAVVSITL